MEQANKWSAKDVITTILLSALLIVVQFVVNIVGMVNNFVSMVLSVGITCLLCAPIYFLMVRRVHKRFVSLVYMTLLGLVFLLMGNWFLLPYFVLVGAICEAILWKEGAYDSARRITAAWTTYSALYIGVNLLPLWMFWDTFEQFALGSGMSPEYIASYVGYYSNTGWVVFIFLLTAACGLVGSLIGNRIMNKHFKKAGML
jgi:energy-coupling factor transport system substrate-specific component